MPRVARAGFVLVVLVLTGLAGVAALGRTPVEAATAPTLTLSTSTLNPGQTIMIGGTGWPPNMPLQAVLCGSDASSGGNDCSVEASSTFAAWSDGTVHGQLVVVIPPVPCPCVVQITAVANDFIAKLPVTLVGAVVAPVTPPSGLGAGGHLTATASVTGASTLKSFFGGGAARQLHVTVHNPTAGVVHTVITARWGRSTDPEIVITSPDPVTLQPGQTRTVQLPFTVNALSFGTYHVAGALTGAAASGSFTSTTSTYPWGIPVVALGLIGLLIYRAVRRRQKATQEQRALEDVGAVEGATGLGALAAMSGSVALPTRGDGSLRLTDVLLTGELHGEIRTVPVSVLTMDARGVGVTNPDTGELRVLTWSSIRSLQVVPADGSDVDHGMAGAGPVSPSATVEVDTIHTIYRFSCPRSEPGPLSAQVDEVSRRWLSPPVRVPVIDG